MLLFSLACAPPEVAVPENIDMVRYRPVEWPQPEGGVSHYLPEAQWDAGLATACQQLIATLREPAQPLAVEAMLAAEKKAGYPGQAHFVKILNGGKLPSELLQKLRGYGEIDIAYAKRNFADGRVLWIVAWAKHSIEVDPIPLSVPLDGSVSLRIGEYDSDRALLYIASPDRPIERIELLPQAHRWLQNFHVPGEYRLEVMLQEDTDRGPKNEIALLFSVFVETDVPSVQNAGFRSEIPNPISAEQELFLAVNRLRAERHLPPLKSFPLFNSLAREHASLMASTGVVAHQIAGVTTGVPEKAASLAHPRAQHFQNVAAAQSASEVLALAMDSPGHFQVFLCETCTHMSVGAALEPTLHPNPRLFVTWEVLAFPQGIPQKIDKLNRDY